MVRDITGIKLTADNHTNKGMSRVVLLTKDLCFQKLISLIYTAGVSDRPSLGTARSPTRVAVTAEAMGPAMESATSKHDRYHSDLLWRVGTYQCGINLLREEAWQQTSLVFEVEHRLSPNSKNVCLADLLRRRGVGPLNRPQQRTF
jgi:hypothetical protein